METPGAWDVVAATRLSTSIESAPLQHVRQVDHLFGIYPVAQFSNRDLMLRQLTLV
jgi:hypothetical protein